MATRKIDPPSGLVPVMMSNPKFTFPVDDLVDVSGKLFASAVVHSMRREVIDDLRVRRAAIGCELPIPDLSEDAMMARWHRQRYERYESERRSRFISSPPVAHYPNYIIQEQG